MVLPMPKKKTPDEDPEKQHERFKETAREHGADESGKAFEKAFGKIVPTKPKTAQPKAHASDCAIYNAPASEPGPCDCGAER